MTSNKSSYSMRQAITYVSIFVIVVGALVGGALSFLNKKQNPSVEQESAQMTEATPPASRDLGNSKSAESNASQNTKEATAPSPKEPIESAVQKLSAEEQ